MPSGNLVNYTGHPDTRLLHGCMREAERCELASQGLEGLRNSLPEKYHAHMAALVEEIRVSGRILRDLMGRSQTSFARVPVLLEYLNVILPCLSKTLYDIDGHIEDRSISKENRWRKMYNKMTDEVGGIPLPQRFVLYNRFLTCIYQLLTRDTNFDLNTLEMLRTRVMELREKRGIAPPPTHVGPLIKPNMALVPISQEPVCIMAAHWAQQIFSLPLPSRTALKGSKRSKSFGPHLPLVSSPLPPDSIVLFRRSLDNESLSITAYLNQADQEPYLMLRSFHQGHQWFSARPVGELLIQRNRSGVELRRWSHSEEVSKLWASFYFITWEEMVLFSCTFSGLKAKSFLRYKIDPDELKLEGERRLFQAQILDDGYKHSLIIYEDSETKGIRLHAAVWSGELRQCPVWTAFVTHQCTSPTWMARKSKHKIWLRDVQLYVFCEEYQQHRQRKGREGAFELDFINEKAAVKFRDVFYPPSSPTFHTDSEMEGGPSK